MDSNGRVIKSEQSHMKGAYHRLYIRVHSWLKGFDLNRRTTNGHEYSSDRRLCDGGYEHSWPWFA